MGVEGRLEEQSNSCLDSYRPESDNKQSRVGGGGVDPGKTPQDMRSRRWERCPVGYHLRERKAREVQTEIVAAASGPQPCT